MLWVINLDLGSPLSVFDWVAPSRTQNQYACLNRDKVMKNLEKEEEKKWKISSYSYRTMKSSQGKVQTRCQVLLEPEVQGVRCLSRHGLDFLRLTFNGKYVNKHICGIPASVKYVWLHSKGLNCGIVSRCNPRCWIGIFPTLQLTLLTWGWIRLWRVTHPYPPSLTS